MTTDLHARWAQAARALTDGTPLGARLFGDDHIPTSGDLMYRAAEIVLDATPLNVGGYQYADARRAVRLLNEAGLLATPERDAVVTANALRRRGKRLILGGAS